MDPCRTRATLLAVSTLLAAGCTEHAHLTGRVRAYLAGGTAPFSTTVIARSSAPTNAITVIP